MNQIDDLPRERDFGKGFDYTRWDNVTSEMTLFRVPWSSDYRDIAFFPSHNDLQVYLEKQKSIKVNDFGRLLYNQPVKVSIPVNEAMEYNYVRIYNPAAPSQVGYPDHARFLYYFINDVIHESTNTTRLVLQLDAWTTFGREIKFGQMYVEQGHVGIAENTIQPGTQGVLTQPDGMNLGADYAVMETKEFALTLEMAQYRIVVVSTIDLETDAGTLAKPNRNSAKGSDWENLPNGASIYVFAGQREFLAYIASMSETPWTLEGIISITAMPVSIFADEASVPKVSLNGHQAWKPDATTKLEIKTWGMYANFKNDILTKVEARHRHLKKFSVYPYSLLEMSMYTGEPVVLKPELWSDDNATVVIKSHVAPPSPRFGVRPYNYNTEKPAPIKAGVDPDKTDNGEVWNVAMWLANFPQFTVVNNGYLTTMASQSQSIAASYKDLGWQQQRAMSGNQLSYNQASSGMNLANDMTQTSVAGRLAQTNQSNMTAGMHTAYSGAKSVVGGAVMGGVGGAVIGGARALDGIITTSIDVNQANQANAIGSRVMQSQNDLQVGNQGFVRDTNKNYADFATQGDYQNSINVLNAKVEDAKMTQPTTAGTSGGDAFALVNGGWVVRMKLKMVPKGARATLGDYWLRYGYPINRFAQMPLNYQCCEVFTYWKLKEAYIIDARCPEPMKQAIRGIFEKGVTVWHKPEQMGQHTAMLNNAPIYKNYLTNA